MAKQTLSADFTEGAEEADGEGIERDQYLVFTAMGQEYGIQAMRVQEISAMIEITKVPKTPEFVEGVINLRGKIVPVLDLRKRFGLVGHEFTAQSRIIVVNIDNRVLGLLVDSVSEVLQIPAQTIEPPPPLVAGIDAAYQEIVALVTSGQLTADIDATFRLEQYADALGRAEHYRRHGKVLFVFGD